MAIDVRIHNDSPKIRTPIVETPYVVTAEDIQGASTLAVPSTDKKERPPLRDVAERYKPLPPAKAWIKALYLGVKIVVKDTFGMFKCRTTYTEELYERCRAATKTFIVETQKSAEARSYLGMSLDLWEDYMEMLTAAIEQLEDQSFIPPDMTFEEAGGSTAAFMVANQLTLLKDLEVLNDLLLLARNMLASVPGAQNASAKSGFIQQVIDLVDLCVRITSRGYDGDTGTGTETMWTNMIAGSKRLLTTSLQVLHNSVMRNENQKLFLWLSLFSEMRPDELIRGPYGKYTATQPDGFDANPFPQAQEEMLRAQYTYEIIRALKGYAKDIYGRSIQEDWMGTMSTDGSEPKQPEPKPSDAVESSAAARELSKKYPNIPEFFFSAIGPNSVPFEITDAIKPTEAAEILGEYKTKIRNDEFRFPFGDDDDAPEEEVLDLAAPEAIHTRSDMGLREVPEKPFDEDDQADLDSLQAFDGDSDEMDELSRNPGGKDPISRSEINDRDEIDSQDELDPEDDDADSRCGVLTEVPLVLGPQEIEALPMLIQSGIMVHDDASGHDRMPESEKVMQSLRCYQLVSQQPGRNLLRELLIFVAAWDLQEDEMFFRLMMNIMSAVLYHGLMPFLYTALSEDKDTVSPAQSILVKILTQVFRKKQPGLDRDEESIPRTGPLPTPTQHEANIVKFIFAIFRQSIIPQTCSLIYLQAETRAGTFGHGKFPLNLWDMERVYEGVYQYLEFFAVLTETEVWKDILIEQEIVYELTTLLYELESGIPRSKVVQAPKSAADAAMHADLQNPASGVESLGEVFEHTTLDTETEVAQHEVYDPASPTPQVYSPTSPAPPSTYEAQPHDTTPKDEESPLPPFEASEAVNFEWRNLKKLVVLVLSSLVWRSRTVQTQIRLYGGVELILACCNYDANNPYIKDHAVMCLRFLLEGNEENQRIVSELEARRIADIDSPEAQAEMERLGIEAEVDENGKVRLMRRGVEVQSGEDYYEGEEAEEVEDEDLEENSVVNVTPGRDVRMQTTFQESDFM